MINKFTNRNFQIKGQISSPYFNQSFTQKSLFGEESQKTTFKDVLGNISSGISKELNEPDRLLTEVLSGNDNVDVHDITTAMAKAEMTVTLATNITSKILTAYEKITQISV